MAKGRARSLKAKTRRAKAKTPKAKAKISGTETPKEKAKTEAKMQTGIQKTATKPIAHHPHGRADRHLGKTLAVKLVCLCGLLNDAHLGHLGVGMIEDTPLMTRDTPPTTAGKIAKAADVIAKVPVEMPKAPIEIAKALVEIAESAAEMAKAMEKAPTDTAAIESYASQPPVTDATLAALLPRGSLHLPAILHRLLLDKALLEQAADHHQLDLPLRLL